MAATVKRDIGKDLLKLVDLMTEEKKIAKDVIFGGIEAAIQQAAEKHFGITEETAGQEGVPGADRRDRVEGLGPDLDEALLDPLADDRDAAVGTGDRRLAGAEPEQLGETGGEVAGVGELLADELLGLALVGGDDGGAGADSFQHRLALGVEDDDQPAGAEVLDEAGVEVVPGAGVRATGPARKVAMSRRIQSTGTCFVGGKSRSSTRSAGRGLWRRSATSPASRSSREARSARATAPAARAR